MNKKGLIIAGIVAVLAIAGGTTCYFMFNKPVTTGTETTTTSTGEVNTSTTQTGEVIVNLEMPNVEYKTNDVATPFATTLCNKYYIVYSNGEKKLIEGDYAYGESAREKDVWVNINTTFKNGLLPVYKSSTNNIIIDENGNTIIETSVQNLGIIGNNFIGNKDENLGSIVIIDKNGNILKEYQEFNRYKYIGEGYTLLSNSHTEQFKENKTLILDKDGNEVLSYGTYSTYISAHVKNNFLTIDSGSITDLNTKETKTFMSGDKLLVNTVSEDKNIIVLGSEEEDTDILINGNHYWLPATCKKVTLKNNIAFCNNYESAYKLTDSGLEYLDLTNKIIFDENNYAIETNSNVEIYENGKTTATLENKHLASNIKYMANKVILVRDNNYNYSYYYINGKRIMDKLFKEADNFNEYGLAVVREEGNYKLINLKGDTLTKEYQNITFKDNYYLAKNNNNTYDVINLKGEVVTTANTDRLTFITRNDDRHFLVITNNTTKSVIDFDKKITIIDNIESPDNYSATFDNNIIRITKDTLSNTTVYTYNGVLLSEFNQNGCQAK